MKNKVQQGKTITVTGPVGGVVAGELFMVGDQPCVAIDDIPAGELGEAETEGVFNVPKNTGEGTIGQGVSVYFDSINKKVSLNTSGGSPTTTFKKVGRAWQSAVTGATLVDVKLTES